MRQEIPEYILCAAVWYKELELKKPEVLQIRGFNAYNIDKGILFCGWRHANCIYQMVALTGLRDFEAGESEQGFLTSRNRFLTREEAAIIAMKQGQTEKDLIITTLFSEDLY